MNIAMLLPVTWGPFAKRLPKGEPPIGTPKNVIPLPCPLRPGLNTSSGEAPNVACTRCGKTLSISTEATLKHRFPAYVDCLLPRLVNATLVGLPQDLFLCMAGGPSIFLRFFNIHIVQLIKNSFMIWSLGPLSNCWVS